MKTPPGPPPGQPGVQDRSPKQRLLKVVACRSRALHDSSSRCFRLQSICSNDLCRPVHLLQRSTAETDCPDVQAAKRVNLVSELHSRMCAC